MNDWRWFLVCALALSLVLGVLGILTKATPAQIHIGRIEIQSPETNGVRFILEDVSVNATSRTLDWMILSKITSQQ